MLVICVVTAGCRKVELKKEKVNLTVSINVTWTHNPFLFPFCLSLPLSIQRKTFSALLTRSEKP